MSVTISEIGIYENVIVNEFLLKNEKGMQVRIMNFGATITSIKIPSLQGKVKEVACGFNVFKNYFSKEYTENAPYFGGTIGRYCSQLKNSKFKLNNEKFQLAKNCGNNNLHGGNIGFDKRIWEASIISNKEGESVKMTLKSLDMEEGFPGNVNVSVIFSVTKNNDLKIKYQAISDKDTPFSITNHTYFNLSGFTNSVENHSIEIKSGNKLAMDSTGACTGEIINLDNAIDDLRISHTIKDIHKAMNDGFEHYYVFDKNNFELEQVATIGCPESGIKLEVASSEPGMLFYTGKYTSNKLKRENGLQYGKYRGFCCETHRYPNGPNINGPKSILKANEKFESTTVFSFTSNYI